jgi:glycosyltransferase involved in cell wall biosynthesis
MILGSGTLENEIRELIDSKKYFASILLAGDVDHEITLSLIERSDVLLRPTYFDGDAVSIREALFLDTPVVATDNGMRPAGVDLISMPPRAETLAAKVVEVLSDKTRQNFQDDINGWENIEAVIDVYKELMRAKGSRPT